MKQWLLLLTIVSNIVSAFGQQAAHLPIVRMQGTDVAKPLVLYISGDGGMNSFSKSFMKGINQQGFAVVGLNAKEYFWKKKTPEQAAADISDLLRHCLNEWKQKSFVLVGYSFGADVAPFVSFRLPQDLAAQMKGMVLLSPSETTTFEIKITDMLGIGQKNGASVVTEINKLHKSLLLLLGSDEKNFPINQIRVRERQVILLKGGHHYDGNSESVVNKIMPFLASCAR